MIHACHIWLGASLLVGSLAAAAEADEFARVVAGFAELEWIAGSGTGQGPLETNHWDPSFEGAPALEVELSNPHFAAADALGRIFIADKESHTILRLDPDGRIYTHAGIHVAGTGMVPSAPANTQALNSPNGIFVKPDGTVFIYDTGNHRVRRVAPNGIMTTVINDASSTFSNVGRGLWVSPDEKTIYYADGKVVKRWSSGVTSIAASGFVELGNIDMHPLTGRLYVTDRASSDATQSAVWRIEADSTKTRVAGKVLTEDDSDPGGDGYLATETFLDQVRGIAFTPEGGYFLCTHKGADIWYVDTSGIIHLFIKGRGTGNRNSGNGQRPPILAPDALSEPRSVALAPNGDLLIATNDNGFIRRVRSAVIPAAPDWLLVDITRHGLHRLQWAATPNQPYLVERAPALSAPWDLLDVVVPGSSVGEWSGPALPAADDLFYRISPPR